MAMAVTYATVAGQILYENRGGVETEFVPDPLGSVIACRNALGTTTYTAKYWPYGEVRTETGTNPSPWGYVGTLGYYRDALNRLYVRARYLLTKLARWQTVDPLWPEEMAYGYVGSKPIAVVDVTGMGKLFDACLAALCASKSTFELVQGVKGIGSFVEKEIQNLLKDQLKEWAKGKCKDYLNWDSPKCLDDARLSPPTTVIGKAIRLICYQSNLRPGSNGVGTCKEIYGDNDNGCNACCDRMKTSYLQAKCRERCAT
jgi:RHS repeat-associated protein